MEPSMERELARLGLTADETRCYLVLLSQGRLTARQLSSATGVSRGRIYDVVGGLLAKGAAVETAGEKRSFEAVAPSVAITNLLDRRRRDLDRRRREIDELEVGATAVADALVAASVQRTADPPLIEWIRHRATARDRCQELEDSARDEILFFIRDPVQNIGTFGAADRALARRVRLRAIYESSLLENDRMVAVIAQFVDAGEEARHAPTLPTRMTVFDRSVTMLPLGEPIGPENFAVLVVRHSGVGAVAEAAFEWWWQHAEPVRLAARTTRRSSRAGTRGTGRG